MSDPSTSIRRHLMGVFGIGLFLVGIYFFVWPPASASGDFLHGSCIKSGLVLLAAWLAFPQLDRLPGWLFATVVGLLLLVAVRPRVFLLLGRVAIFFLPILFLIWLLRPKNRGKRA